MKRRDFVKSVMAVPLAGLIQPAWAFASDKTEGIMGFAHNGSKKMLYDNRQRPQAVYLNGKVFIGYKGNAYWPKTDEKRRREAVANAYTLLISYDTETREFSKPVQLVWAVQYFSATASIVKSAPDRP